MYKQIAKQTREEIILKIKNGETVVQLSNQYGISPKTIYNWLRTSVKPDTSFIEINRLKRENDELKRIIGLITLELERGGKNRNH